MVAAEDGYGARSDGELMAIASVLFGGLNGLDLTDVERFAVLNGGLRAVSVLEENKFFDGQSLEQRDQMLRDTLRKFASDPAILMLLQQHRVMPVGDSEAFLYDAIYKACVSGVCEKFPDHPFSQRWRYAGEE